jgi:hypothetical protein
MAVKATKNLGVWSRFSLALNARTKYVCVFDDDTIPGARWFENCISTYKTCREPIGLLGTVGILFDTPQGYAGPYRRVGWPSSNPVLQKVDLVGHSWFFERKVLGSAFWRENPDFNKFSKAGEDVHFSWMLQKHLELGTFVPPHPKDDLTLWGSQPETAWKYGQDRAAISMAPGALANMNEYVTLARSNGYKFCSDEIQK